MTPKVKEGRLAYPVMPEHGAARGVLVLALLQAEVRFSVRKHALVAAGKPDLAPRPMRLLSARLVDCLQTQQNTVKCARSQSASRSSGICTAI